MITENKKKQVFKDLRNVFKKHDLAIVASGSRSPENMQTIVIYLGDNIMFELSEEAGCLIDKDNLR